MTGRVYELTRDDCWGLLREQELGRLAYHLDGAVQIAPVNYALDGQRIIFRTAEGSKLAGILEDGEVCFEVDTLTDEAAMSVICRGHAFELTGEEALMADQLRLRPWVRTIKNHIVAIEVTQIDGRFFELSKPWAHLLQH